MSDIIQNCNNNPESAITYYDDYEETVICNQIGELYDYDIYYQVRLLIL